MTKSKTKILIIKLAALGDVLRTTSILQGLKEKYRNSEIHWMTEITAVPLLIHNPYIHKVISYDKNGVEELQDSEFDIVINLDEDFNACSLATKIAKKKRYGFFLDKELKISPTATAIELFNMSALGKKPMNDVLKKRNKKTHQQIMHEIVEIPYKDPDTLIYLTEKQLDYSKDFKRRYNISDKDVVIGLNTGSADRWQKQLDIKKTAMLANALYKQYHAKLILFVGPNEIERNNQILALAKVPMIHTGCGNDLFEFPALISICNVFITSDSLGLHVALGLKRKTVAFFGPTSAAEIEMYNLGEKIISKSKCYCCYKPNCKATESIKIEEIERSVSKLLKQKVSIIITAFKEPNIHQAIEAFLNQKIHYEHEMIVAAPDEETKQIVEAYAKKYKHIRYFKDPGKGKSYALNLILKEVKSDILILTDGDVIVSEKSVNEILTTFNDPIVGVVTGRVVSANAKNNMLGYWSHLLADAGAHRIRKELFEERKFLECSGYLFAFRNNVIKQIPLDVAEDTYIPYVFWQKGYKLGYVENAKVFVKNPTTFKDWLKQRTRTSKAHETLYKYVDINFTPRVKSFSNEAKKGIWWALQYPSTLREYYWTLLLFFARAYMWSKVHIDTKLKKKHYQDAWERVESAR